MGSARLGSARHAIKTMSEHLRQRRLIWQRTQVRPNQTAEAALQTVRVGGAARGGAEQELIFFLSPLIPFFSLPANETGLAEEKEQDGGVSGAFA